MYKLRILNKGLENVQEVNLDQLRIEFEIVDEEAKEVARRVLGFPLDSEFDFIKEELAKYLENFRIEKEMSVKNKALDEAYEKSTETLEKLEGLEIE